MIDLTDLSTADLAKLINDEYAVILQNERTNLPKAQKVGEKLKVFQDKAKHGEWKTKLTVHCPKVSYETATLYIRLWDKRDKLSELAKAKSVTVTDLTIQEARKLLAKPKKQPNNNIGGNAGTGTGGVAPPDTRRPEDVGKDWLRALAADELVTTLKEIHRTNTEYLQELSVALGKTLRPTAAADTGASMRQ